jgi:SAM-dependent methyltransferase
VKAVDAGHGWLVHPVRVRVLAEHAARLIPDHSRVLDVGTGDGRLAAAIAERRPDLRIEGLDVLVRDETAIPVSRFDGRVFPNPDDSFDVVTFFDVLHHTEDPAALLREAMRVARSCIVLKDHVCNGGIDRLILRFMDHVGNKRHGVRLPYNYWSQLQWSATIEDLRLKRAVWQVGGLGLYPWPASAVFGRGLHVMARLECQKQV